MIGNGATRRFRNRSHYSGLRARDGEEVTIVRPLTPSEAHASSGQMYRVRFADGFETDAFGDELFNPGTPDGREPDGYPFTTGKNDGTVGPIAFETRTQAEAWIEDRRRRDPLGVARGDYYIDGPGDDEAPVDDEPPFGSFPEERGYDDLQGAPYQQAVDELLLRAREDEEEAPSQKTEPRTQKVTEAVEGLRAGWRRLASGTYLKVAGRCPMGCGETLFLSYGGHVTCSWQDCPKPTAADDILSSHATFHVTATPPSQGEPAPTTEISEALSGKLLVIRRWLDAHRAMVGRTPDKIRMHPAMIGSVALWGIPVEYDTTAARGSVDFHYGSASVHIYDALLDDEDDTE